MFSRNVVFVCVGLSEVLFAMGGENLATAMPGIISTSMSPNVDPCVRDGYIMMYVYMPSVFGPTFQPYLTQVIPAVLKVCMCCCYTL